MATAQGLSKEMKIILSVAGALIIILVGIVQGLTWNMFLDIKTEIKEVKVQGEARGEKIWSEIMKIKEDVSTLKAKEEEKKK